tara:strand:+ start:303 stop:749 length:447 start_codon:yes stop_codon:yes gene_type:complete
MYIAFMGTTQQGSGPAALAVSLTNNGDDFLDMGGVGGEDFPISTEAGQMDFTATASGGDGSYDYAWSITESGDDNNISTGNIRVTDTGSTNRDPQYNDAIVTGLDTGLAAGDVVEAMLFINCTVTDGTGATATSANPLRVFTVVQVFE